MAEPTVTEERGAAGRAEGAPTWWVWLAAAPITAVFVLSNTATPLYVLWQRDIGFSAGTLTVIFGVYMAGLLASLLVAGRASDRLGRKAVMLPALVLAMVACVVFATASSVAALLLARLLSGIAVGALVSAGMAAVTDVAGPSRRRLAALLASCAQVIGAGSGPMFAGVVSETVPAPTVTVYVIEIALLAAAFAAVLRMPVRRPADRGRGSWIRLPRVPAGNGLRLAMGIAVYGPGLTGTSFILALGPSLLAGLLDTDSRVVAGLTAFVMFMAATGIQFALGRLRRRTLLIGGAVSLVAGMAALMVAVHVGSVTALVAAAVLAGAGQGMGQLGGLSLLNSAVPPRRLAEANAALNVGGYVPAGSLPVLAGYVTDATGLATGSTVFAVILMTAAAAGGTLAIATRRHLPEPQP